METSTYRRVIDLLRRLYQGGRRPWSVGYSGGNPNPWSNVNRALLKFYATASNGECPIRIDTSAPSSGHSRLDCWTCTVGECDKGSTGVLASGYERMEQLVEFRETFLFCQNPANRKHDMKRKNGADGPGLSTIEARRELLTDMTR